MKTRFLGHHGPAVSAIGLGCMGIDVALTAEERDELTAAFPPDAAAGLRYPEAMMRLVNT